jgi:MFS family permease
MSKKLSILSISLITVMAGATIAPALGGISSAFPDANQTLVKLINTLHALWVIPFTFVSSWLTTRYSKKSVLTAGLLLYIIGGAGGALATDIWFLLATRTLLGMAVGLIMPISTSLVPDFYHGDERTDMMGKVSASNQLGGMISIIAAGILAAISWRYAFGVYGLALLVLILVWLYLPKQPAPGKKQRAERTKLPKQIYGLALGMFTVFVFFYTIPTNMSIYLQENDIANTTISGFIIALSSLGGMSGGMMLAKFKHLLGYYLVPVQIFLIGAGFSFIAFTSHAVTVSMGVFTLGLGAGTLIPTIYNKISNVATKRQMMTAMAIAQTFMYLGQFMSPIILDSAAGLFGQPTTRLIYSLSAYLTLTVSILLFIFITIKFRPFLARNRGDGSSGSA